MVQTWRNKYEFARSAWDHHIIVSSSGIPSWFPSKDVKSTPNTNSLQQCCDPWPVLTSRRILELIDCNIYKSAERIWVKKWFDIFSQLSPLEESYQFYIKTTLDKSYSLHDPSNPSHLRHLNVSFLISTRLNALRRMWQKICEKPTCGSRPAVDGRNPN